MATTQAGETVIVGLAGSLRKASYNVALLRAARALCPAGARIDEATIREVPLYDGDAEAASGVPPAATAIKEAIARASGLLIVTPEYNNGIPGVLKNTIDWLSRPAADIPRVFGGRPVAIMGATPGRGGTAMAQAAWLPVLRALGVRPWWGPRILVGGAGKVFDDAGRLVDDAVHAQVRDFVAGFAAFTRAGA